MKLALLMKYMRGEVGPDDLFGKHPHSPVHTYEKALMTAMIQVWMVNGNIMMLCLDEGYFGRRFWYGVLDGDGIYQSVDASYREDQTILYGPYINRLFPIDIDEDIRKYDGSEDVAGHFAVMRALCWY